MSLCPFAIQEPAQNHGGPMGPIIGVVIHVTAGENDPGGWFNNPASQVSAHFGIGNGKGGFPDGTIAQYVDTGLTAWAEAAGNHNYISVETEGQPSEPLTQKQLESFAKLYAWIAQMYKVPLTITDTPGQPGFITHGAGGSAWGGHTGCPGELRKAQRQEILNLARPQPPQPPTQTGEDMPLFIITRSDGVGFTTDLVTHKVGLTSGADAQAIEATGKATVIPKGQLTDATIANIPG